MNIIAFIIIMQSYYVFCSYSSNYDNQITRYALLISGQVERLELESKIENLFIPNIIKKNNNISLTVFILLSIESAEFSNDKVKFRNNVYDNNLDYSNANSIVQFIEKKTFTTIYPNESHHHNNCSNSVLFKKFKEVFSVHCIIQNKVFQHGGIANYSNEIEQFPIPSGRFQFQHLGRVNKPGYLSESDLFQRLFRQFNRMRQIVQWMEIEEIKSRKFFDIVIRLREDNYIISKWILDPGFHVGHFTSLESDRWGGLNDRVFVLDRLFVDSILRGFVENFYLSYPMMDIVIPYANTERLLSFLVFGNNYPQHIVNYCFMPVGVIRGYNDNNNNNNSRTPILYNKDAMKKFNPSHC